MSFQKIVGWMLCLVGVLWLLVALFQTSVAAAPAATALLNNATHLVSIPGVL